MDQPRLPNLGALKVFEAAARLESFSRAADELFVTHGAVSHQIRSLEAELGVSLFIREGRRIKLSDTGRTYAQQIRAALGSIAHATHAIRGGQRERRLVVSILPSFAARWLTPRIGRFIERYPEIDLELQSTNALTDFSRDDVDVALRLGGGGYPGLHAETLLDESFFPACAPTLNGGKLPETPADLARFPILRSDDDLWRRWFDAAGLADWPEPRRGVLFQDSSMLLQAAVDAQGVALVRRSLALDEVAAGRLVRLFDIDATSPWSYWFVCPEPILKTARVQALRTWLAEETAAFRAKYPPLRSSAGSGGAGSPPDQPHAAQDGAAARKTP
jgi:LysR family glycine cleavage system transcriptional activator